MDTGATSTERAADTVMVAPREIVDYVTRCCRVAGLDAGSADAVARDVAARQLLDTTTVGGFADALEHGELAAFVEHAVAASVDERDDELLDQLRRSAARHGLVVDAAGWARLQRSASSFLVSEAVLDAAED